MIEEQLKEMKKTSFRISALSDDIKNKALELIAKALQDNVSVITEANNIDMKNAVDLDVPIQKRLLFNEEKINDVIKGIEGLIKLEDPVNKKISSLLLDDGLILNKISVPIGVIGVIFESRPDALVQIATLCIKSGNCVVLKGGSEAKHTNRILADILINTIESFNKEFVKSIFLLESREDVSRILQFNQYINLIIPRGSNEFVQYIQKNSSIPVLGHADGICHQYIDEYADIQKAIRVVIDSKIQYVAVCNATETVLIHKNSAKAVLPELIKALKDKNVEVRGCKAVKHIVSDVIEATEEDWATEYLDYIISIKVVQSIEEAVDHINFYGSGHTDGIITENEKSKIYFEKYVDTSSVVVNCSTRFADGFRYGMGAEVGVSTNKFHARGPVGLDGLIIYKYILEGNAHIVADYSGEHGKKFKHKPLGI